VVEGKDIMGLLMLCVRQSDRVVVSVSGPEAIEASKPWCDLIRFGMGGTR